MTFAVHPLLLLTGVTWCLAFGAAQALPAQRLSIPAQSMARALLQLGAQAGVSIGAGEASACGRSRAVNGVHEVEQALRLMLAESSCTYRRIDARTYLIVRSPPPSPRPVAPAPLPPVIAPVELDTVVVTATKREIALANAPYSLSAVNGAAFDAAARRDTAALATRLAGLTVTNLGPGRNKLFVRGLADSALTGQTQAMVGLYLDDTRLTYDAPDPDLRLVDLDRVELLRGPQGTLYGAGAMGGVLKLVSKPPRLDAYEREISTGLTFADDTAPGHSADVVFNAPLLRDRLAVRVVLYEEVLEGMVDDPGHSLTNTGATARNGGRVGLAWRINDRWDARLASVFQELHINDSQYGFERLPPYQRALSVREPSNNDFNGVSLSLTGDYDWGRVRVTSAYQGHDLDRRYDATTAADRFGGTGGPLAYDETDSIRAFALETSVASAPGASIGWLLGLYGSHYSHNRTGEVLDLQPDVSLYVADKRDDTNEGAVFAEGAWSPTHRLKLILGGRYFYVSTRSRTLAGQGEAVTDAFRGQIQDDGVVSKGVIEYALNDTALIFAQVSQGYRVGGINGGVLLNGDLGQPGAGLQPYREFRPDTLNSQELGVRWRGFSDRLGLRLAAFFVDWSAIQSDRVSADGLPFTANVGSGSNEGIELEGVWSDGPWRVDLNFMGSNPRLDAADDSYPLATDGDLPGVPKVLGAFSVRRETRFYGLDAWASAGLGYVGRSTQQLTPEVTTDMGGYFTTEFATGLSSGPWSASLRLDNLFGDDGDTFGYGNPFLVSSEAVLTPQRSRNLSLSLTRRF
ncbi:MAG: TonB-dependent receptor [Alphaproteobacteria bacterium]|uniref:TonB-dependent receptor domain-containing protein n=1 Tax=Brevundimonas sp. TaxID=1871086 RepID=UPI001DBC9F3F|nr:TonB-dependent receptor [Alphaproteobacteria bacterium]MBU1520326.1 TonB-dependent receptor [Alphaproteobacteria bacterium]MBU2030805.1 TonB-dependent receptor [Alphaproteobacteria bacterium]MBU2163497.1 TonB-dependent receptor [Alphaproteobacteria bacterium]MBU2231602.1 TonB-dependent receptor [Alphaproteobacteria bacterium]